MRITDPEGHVSETVYDLLGRKVQSTDPAGKITSCDYTDSGRIWKVTDALGGITEYGYDLRGNRTLVRDANGHETTFEFDRMDRLIRETNPLGKVTAFTYAADGARLTKLDPKGQLIEYFHDSNRRLTDILYPDGSGTHFGYDERGNKVYEDNGTTSRSYVHDALNRVVQVTDFELGKSITYEYGPGGQRSKMIGPEGEETAYRYDASNRIRELVDPDGGRYVFGYDAAGRRTSLSFPNGVKAAYSYDQASRLIDMVYKNSAGDVLSSFAYTHDAAGNRLSKTLASGGVESYGYDLLHRLVNASYPSGRQVSYDYDPVGNRNFVQETSAAATTETTTYTYSEFNQVLSTTNSAGVTTYGWDDNGNLTAKLSASGALTQYGYNYENRLSSILYAGGAINQFGYDTQGIRTMKQDSEGLQRYLIDQASVLADYDGVGNQTARYTLNPQRIDEMLGQHQAQGKFYHLVDGLGSVYGLTNEAGVKIASYGYDAYGATAEAQVPGGLANRWMFTGRELDADSGLQYNRARYYLSGVGSWNREDPINGRSTQGRLLFEPSGYGYSKRPTLERDPSGMITITGSRGVTMTAAGGVGYSYGYTSEEYSFDTDGNEMYTSSESFGLTLGLSLDVSIYAGTLYTNTPNVCGLLGTAKIIVINATMGFPGFAGVFWYLWRSGNYRGFGSGVMLGAGAQFPFNWTLDYLETFTKRERGAACAGQDPCPGGPSWSRG